MALRYLTFDMKSFQPTSEIPEIADPSVQFEINASETIALTIPLNSTQVGIVQDPTVYAMPRCGIAVEKDGVLIAAGPLLQRHYDFKAGTVQLTARGIYEVLQRRIDYDVPLTPYHHFEVASSAQSPFVADHGIGWDQNAIIVFLINELQGEDHGWLNIDVSGVQAVGVKRDFLTWGYNLKSYYDLMQDRADLVNGFDFRFTPRWKNGVRNSEVEWALEIFYPPSGRVTNLVFQLGSNCDFENATVDGSQIAFKAYSVGAGDGNSNLIGSDTDAQYVAADYLLEWVDREHTDVTQVATANTYAQQARKRRMKESNIPSIVIPFNQITDMIVGDQCRVLANYGLYQVDETCRIMSITGTPKEGVAKLTVSPLSLNGN